MKPNGTRHSLITIPTLLTLPATLAWGQASPLPSSPPAGGEASTGGGTVVVVLLVLALLVIVGVAVKTYDVRRRQKSDALYLQATLSDALMREPSLFGLSLAPSAHVPIWKRSPVVIELAGQVPSPQARETALSIVRAEAARIRSDFQIEDRVAVVPRRVA